MKKKRELFFYLLPLIFLIPVLLQGCQGYYAPVYAPQAAPTPSPQVAPTPVPTTPTPATPTPSTATPSEKIVDITSSGFSPRVLTINVGDTVKFVNQDSKAHWPASAIHPTHKLYPEGGGCIGSKFDACQSIGQGESYSFTFNIAGNWDYHDHVNPALTGTIVVRSSVSASSSSSSSSSGGSSGYSY